ncbi:MAG: DUF342 domain-containing protein [Desulfobulbaceae bacterium]|nr:DUF342 domain-containing protein [Desulfobulbaceae bacterium]
MNQDTSEFNMRITDDKTAVLLDCSGSEADIDYLVRRIHGELISLGINPMPRKDELKTLLLMTIKSGALIKDQILAQGKTPVPPVDESIRWEKNFSCLGFVVDIENEESNFSNLSIRSIVKKDQVLTHLYPSVSGSDGCDVFGNSIPVRAPLPLCPGVHVGPNIRVVKKINKLEFVSTIKGCLRWASGVLAVDEVKTIYGNISPRNGHLTYPGTIVIQGDVCSGSEITAGGSIEIQGSLESATIRAGGHLVVGGGITGSTGRDIKVKGGVTATYISEARIEAGENIVIKNEIVQSEIRTNGAVVLPVGRLLGGKITALGGVITAQAGSEAHVPTELVVAEDYTLGRRLASRKEKLLITKDELKQLRKMINKLMADQDLLSADQREKVTILHIKKDDREKIVQKLTVEIQKIEAESRIRAKPDILILEALYPGTTLKVAEAELRVKDVFTTPVRTVLVNRKVVLKELPKKKAEHTRKILGKQKDIEFVTSGNFTTHLSRSVQKLFSTMLGCEAKHGKLRIASNEGKPDELIAVIELSGPVRGTVVMIFPTNTALAIISKMSGIKIQAVDKMVTDGVGEVLNMVAGTAKRKLAKDDFPPVNIGLPTVVNGNAYLFASSMSKWLELAFTSDLGPFILRVTFT